MMSAVSTVAADAASDVEDLAATGRLEDCRPHLERLQAMADDLLREAARLSIEALRLRIEAADAPTGRRERETAVRDADSDASREVGKRALRRPGSVYNSDGSFDFRPRVYQER
jgi:hypothetical protein